MFAFSCGNGVITVFFKSLPYLFMEVKNNGINTRLNKGNCSTDNYATSQQVGNSESYAEM